MSVYIITLTGFVYRGLTLHKFTPIPCIHQLLQSDRETTSLICLRRSSDHNNMKIILIYAASWVGMVILAVVNGAIREKVYGQLMPELLAHQLSTFIALILLGAYIWCLTGVWRIDSSKQALVIGCMWLITTIVFELVFGHYVMGHSWGKLFHDYNLLKGRVWSLVLIWTAVAPYVFYRMRS